MAQDAPSHGKTLTRSEVAERGSRRDAVFIVDNVVYDVAKFLDEHPGGHEVLLNVAGKDASEEFDDVGHSLDAKELMTKYVIGQVPEAERRPVRRRAVAWDPSPAQDASSPLSSWKLPLVLGVLLTVLYSYLFG